MSSEFNTIDGMETVETPETTEATESAETTDTTEAEAIMSEVTTPTASATIEISNVSKADVDGQKRDKTAIDVILVRSEADSDTVTVFYKDKMKLVKKPATVGPIGTVLDDGGLVMGAKDGKVRRIYATLHLTLDDLADKIVALPDDAWQPRHKNRPSTEG